MTSSFRFAAASALVLLAIPSLAMSAGGALAAETGTTAGPVEHRSFATPDDAAAALVAALKAGGGAELQAVLGPGAEKLVNSGDPTEDRNNRNRFLTAYAEKHSLVQETPDQVRFVVGAHDWPLPIPIEKTDGHWQFDATEGAQEIVDRTIGRNEIAAIRTCLAYVDAQQDYYERSSDLASGARYAQRLISSPGRYNGLYWPAEAGEPDSPLGPLVDQARDEGYPGEFISGHPAPYQGYFFRILKQQGPDATGGAKDYVGKDGLMSGGFALVAWPARYGASGIMSFQVNQDGIVFQKDLGPSTAARVKAMTAFNPDLSWARVEVEAGK